MNAREAIRGLTLRLPGISFFHYRMAFSGATKTFRRVIMNKAELIERVSKDTNLTKTDVENALNSITRWIKDCVKKNDEVKLIGFGTFTKTKRKARTGRNPQTGAEIKIPATNVPRFKPGKEFKDLVN